MVDPWLNPTYFGAYYGTFVGGVGGSLGGILGAIAGWCVPKNKGRKFILGAMWFFVFLGIPQVLFGAIALLAGQPYGIWYPPLLCGVIFTIVFGILATKMRFLYNQFDRQKLPGNHVK